MRDYNPRSGATKRIIIETCPACGGTGQGHHLLWYPKLNKTVIPPDGVCGLCCGYGSVSEIKNMTALEIEAINNLLGPELREAFGDMLSRHQRIIDHECNRMRDCACPAAKPCSRCEAGALLIGEAKWKQTQVKKVQGQKIRERGAQEKQTA